MQDSPLISVVVPTYNRQDLVLDALNSIWKQDFRPIELLVVDDGSTDETQSVVEDWISKHQASDFQAIYLRQKNLGGNVARNLGVASSSGSLIGFLDSDDLWHESKLEKQVATILRDERIGGVYCGLRHVVLNSSAAPHTPDRNYPTGSILESLLVKDVTAPTSAYLVRRSAFDKVGSFDESLQARQDWDMWIRIASEFDIDCVPEALVDYRDHDGPRTYSDPKRELVAYRQILDKYQHLHQRYGWITRRKIWASYYRRAARVYSHRKISKVKAIGFAFTSIYYWPFAFDTYAALIGILLPSNLRAKLNRCWNFVFGRTPLAIRSH